MTISGLASHLPYAGGHARVALSALALAGCGAASSASGAGGAPLGELVASSARLPAPPSIEPGVRGASYLSALAAQLQPKWGDFLEDCRLRLPRAHPLNQPGLAAAFELAIDPSGAIAMRREVATSGNGDFDTAVADVLADVAALPAPPIELLSDDDRVHVRWQFARDRRQAGPATARVLQIERPLRQVVDGLVARGELARAAGRIVAAPPATADRGAATEHVMIAALREALASPDGAARLAAVEACGRARVDALAEPVRVQLVATTDPGLRLAAITAAGQIGDRAAGPALVAVLHDELIQHARFAGARVAALAAIGRAADAAAVLRAVLEAGPNPSAIAALADAPVPALGAALAGWARRGDAATRGAVCMALPAAVPDQATALIAHGLGDADARVRAACAEAAGRGDPARADPALLARLHALARDRDAAVRGQAITALIRLELERLGHLDPAHPLRAAGDPAPAVRAAFAPAATPLELRALAGDREPEVRAAALAAIVALGDRAHERVIASADDPSPVVRLAAIAVLGALGEPGETAVLARLAGDAAPEVAQAALIRLAAIRGQAAVTAELLDQLIRAPAASAERARIALAWLLAS